MEDLASFDEDLSDCLYKLPTENLPLVSEQTNRSIFNKLSLLHFNSFVSFAAGGSCKRCR